MSVVREFRITEMILSWQKLDDGRNDGINDAAGLDQQILALLAQQPSLTVTKLAEQLNKSSRTVERHMGLLKKQGKLKRVGSNKGGYWKVVKE